MDDEEPDHPHQLLHRHVRVVEERAVLLQRELEGVAAARRNRVEAEPGHAVDVGRDLEPVPVRGEISGRLFSTTMRTRSPSVHSMVGPGTDPLKPHASTARPGTKVVRTGSATRWKTFTPPSRVKGRVGTSGVSTRTGTVLTGGGNARREVTGGALARAGASPDGGIRWPACGSGAGVTCAAAGATAAALPAEAMR